MPKITDTSLFTALVAPVDTDYLVVVDASTGTVKLMDIQYLLVALDGDHLDVDFTPTYYTPASTPAEASDADDLSAHLYGIDQALKGIPYYQCTNSTTFTVVQKYVEVDTSGGAVTGTLPSAATAGAGYNYIFKLTDATNAFTIATNGAETIETLAGFQMTKADEYFEIISDGTNWKVIRWDSQRVLTQAQFAYGDATSYTVESGCYELPTSKFKKVYWTAKLTLGPDTWAAGSTAITTTGWHYLYLDQSAIDAGSTPSIQDSHFISSTTAPSWDSDYDAWYNGNDRCIWAVRFSAASTLLEFLHDGNQVFFADAVATRANAALTTSWVDVTFSIPGFCRRVQAHFHSTNNDHTTDTYCVWRTNGQTGAVGHEIFDYYVYADNEVDTRRANTMIVITDSTWKIEVKLVGTAGTEDLEIDNSGYFLPRGI